MDVSTFRKPGVAAPVAVAGLLFIAGLGGNLTEAWGYGLLLVATLLLAGGIASFLTFVLTRSFDTAALHGTYTWLLRLGGWGYVLGVSALSGYFCHETLNGHMEAKWILFGPAALAALVVLDLGLYRLLVARNLPTWQRYGHLISRQQSHPAAMRRTLVDDVILHRSLFSVSGFRWFKHTLIFWGFAAMFGIEIVAVFVREGFPAFGMTDIWEIADHPVRLAFDVAFDLTGLMVLVGCILALIWRVMVNGTELQKFSDTPTALFLFIVVLSGFVVEGLRINITGPLPTDIYSFVGLAFAAVLPAGDAAAAPYDGLWLFHVLASCAFIAYVPVKRMVHSCATPMGRLMNSQKELLAAKKEHSLRGLMAGKEP